MCVRGDHGCSHLEDWCVCEVKTSEWCCGTFPISSMEILSLRVLSS